MSSHSCKPDGLPGEKVRLAWGNGYKLRHPCESDEIVLYSTDQLDRMSASRACVNISILSFDPLGVVFQGGEQ